MSIHEKTLPDISATTPKISLFKYTSSGEELIAACIKQATDPEFSDIAGAKLRFMAQNAPNESARTACVIRNATGVRLSLVSAPVPPGTAADYPAPAIIEPGECASFLGPNNIRGAIAQYEVQVFEGPVATPIGGGWQAPTGDLKIPQFQLTLQRDDSPIPVTPSTAKAKVQDMRGGGFVSSTLTWTFAFPAFEDRVPDGITNYYQYTLTQSLD